MRSGCRASPVLPTVPYASLRICASVETLPCSPPATPRQTRSQWPPPLHSAKILRSAVSESIAVRRATWVQGTRLWCATNFARPNSSAREGVECRVLSLQPATHPPACRNGEEATDTSVCGMAVTRRARGGGGDAVSRRDAHVTGRCLMQLVPAFTALLIALTAVTWVVTPSVGDGPRSVAGLPNVFIKAELHGASSRSPALAAQPLAVITPAHRCECVVARAPSNLSVATLKVVTTPRCVCLQPPTLASWSTTAHCGATSPTVRPVPRALACRSVPRWRGTLYFFRTACGAETWAIYRAPPRVPCDLSIPASHVRVYPSRWNFSISELREFASVPGVEIK